MSVVIPAKDMSIALVHNSVHTKENNWTNHIAQVTVALNAFVQRVTHVNHMIMAAVDHNAHKVENKLTNHFALLTVVQLVSVPVNQINWTVVNHSASNKEDKLIDLIVLANVVKNVCANVRILQLQSSNNVKINVRPGIKLSIREV